MFLIINMRFIHILKYDYISIYILLNCTNNQTVPTSRTSKMKPQLTIR